MGERYRRIYQSEAARYDALVSREDHEGNLARALAALVPARVERALEVGAGTGRVTALLAPLAAHVQAFDGSAHMVAHAKEKLQAHRHVLLDVADNASLPVAGRSVDLAVAGWTFGHAVGWFPSDWPARIDAQVGELLRTLRTGGLAIVIETLGTGRLEASPPNEGLAAYYARLEERFGFERRVIRTDYRFANLEEAIELAGSFFGDAMAERIREHAWVVLPEHTGIWSRRAL